MTHIKVEIDLDSDVKLRTIENRDCESLRIAKNLHRQFFFHQKEIDHSEQQSWFDSYRIDPDNFMFVIEVDSMTVGCLGYRLTETDIDFYNLILWDAKYLHAGLMKKALEASLKNAQVRYPEIPIRVRVLVSNPAIGWYTARGFTRQVDMNRRANIDYVTLEFDTDE